MSASDDCKDTPARLESKGRHLTSAPGRTARRSSSRASHVVAIALFPCANGLERRVEVRAQTEPGSDVAKLDDPGAHR